MTDEFDDLLHRPRFLADLLITALERNADRPALYLGDVVLTGGQMRDQISSFGQALESLGVGKGSTVAMLSKEPPRGPHQCGSQMILGCRNTALAPMGSLDDHSYILGDAEIEDPHLRPDGLEGRAAELKAAVPTLKNLFLARPSRWASTSSNWRRRSRRSGWWRRPWTATTRRAWSTRAAPPVSRRAWSTTFRSGVTLPQYPDGRMAVPDEMRFLA